MTLPQKIRSDFPILKDKHPFIYFDGAATSQKPQEVLDAMHTFYSTEYGTVHRSIYALSVQATGRYNAVREKVAALIHAPSPEQIVFTRGTTDSLNLVANSFGQLLEPGDEVLITEMEHHANFVPWQLLQERRGIVLRIAPVTDRAEIDRKAFSSLLSSKTKLLSIAHVANSTGTINPIEELIAEAHAVGAKVCIDAAQSIAHLPINVTKLDTDFLAFSGHKVFGPTGIGILYGKKELLEAMPPIQGGGDMIEKVSAEKTTFQPPPLRFEAGTPPIAEVIGLGAAIDYLERIGLAEITKWEGKLLAYATKKIETIPGLKIIGTAKQKIGIINFTIDGIHPLDLATLLDTEGIAIRSGHHCAQPLLARFGLTASCRISFSPFNTIKEIDQFFAAFQKACDILLKTESMSGSVSP